MLQWESTEQTFGLLCTFLFLFAIILISSIWVYYLALSRAKKRLFLYLDDLTTSDEKKIKDKYGIRVEKSI